MKIYIVSTIPEYGNEFSELTRAFFPGTEVRTDREVSHTIAEEDILFSCSHIKVQEGIELTIEYKKGKNGPVKHKEHHQIPKTMKDDILGQRRWIKNRMKLSLYDFLSELREKDLDWGALTGVSPTKLAHDLLDMGYKDDKIAEKLYDDYRIKEKKARLLLSVAKVQRPYFNGNHPKKISIYVNIPLCTSKCLFCSFPSDTIDRCYHLLDDYIWALDREMEAMSLLARHEGMEVESIYIGGGTPTSLGMTHLEGVLKSISKHWGFYPWNEYTLEGGRPDTMNENKLKMIKNYGVSRISINPQTMNDTTLKAIGRVHSAEEVRSCFNIARKLGFDTINMDVIVGLPGEGVDDSYHTMEEIKKLSPDNLTVHTLAIKRASRLKDRMADYKLIDEDTAGKMMDTFYKGANAMGMEPYYLYRQKYMLGNMENVGLSMPGKESIYNMQMMEDRQSIWAFGAGAITKVCYPKKGRIERAPNVKNIGDYIERIDEMIERKRRKIYDN